MKRYILPLLIMCSAAGAQTVNLSITGVSPTVIVDIRTHWLDQASPTVATTTEAVDGSTVTVTVGVSQSSLSATQPMPVAGQTVVIGGEPMICTAATSNSLTLLRSIPLTPLTAHPTGATIAILKYVSPWDMMSTEALRPWIQGIFSQLGSRSLTLGGAATGTVTQ